MWEIKKYFLTAYFFSVFVLLGYAQNPMSAAMAVFQFGDKAEVPADWSSGKRQITDILDLDKELAFGKRSVFDQAFGSANNFFYQVPLENRHLVLIIKGADSFHDSALRDSVKANLLDSGSNVHVISFTKLRKNSVAPRKQILVEGNHKPPRTPEEVVENLPDFKRPGEKKKFSPRDMAKMPQILGVTLDRKRTKRVNEDLKEIETDELFLTTIAENANGEILLPETYDETIEQTILLARAIDTQYVVTHTPKRPLRDSPSGEIRLIEASSRRNGVRVEARRRLSVQKMKSHRRNVYNRLFAGQ